MASSVYETVNCGGYLGDTGKVTAVKRSLLWEHLVFLGGWDGAGGCNVYI